MQGKNIEFSENRKKELVSDIKNFFSEELDQDIGDLKAEMVLAFMLKKIGAKIYNQGIADARKWFRDKFDDLDGDFFLLEKDDN